jgi:hypothetical protein
MSESAPESSGRGNVFTRKMGPLPLWAWLGIATLVAVAYYAYAKNKAANSTASQSTAGTGGSAGTTDQSLVPQFVNQTYVNSSPPVAPAPNGGKTVSTSTKEYSWTDTGQKWSATELAKKLGISLDDLKATNALGAKALKDPNKPIAKGAHFTYDKGPTGVTTTKTS